MSQDKWDNRYLSIAKLVAGWSKDSAKVGAVIVSNNRIVATGFNGLPSEVLDSHDRLVKKSKKLEMTVHAEENALIVAGRNAIGSTIYVHGKPICGRCAGSIIQAGIARVVAMHPDKVGKKSKWYKRGLLAVEMFTETDIQFHPKTCEKQGVQAKKTSKRERKSMTKPEENTLNGRDSGTSTLDHVTAKDRSKSPTNKSNANHKVA